MDVGAVLREARQRARLNQGQLADAAGTSRGAVGAYESGRRSPTVRTLDRLLAGCGLQARIALEPLFADLDVRVDELLTGAPELDVDRLARFSRCLNDAPDAERIGIGAPPPRRGAVRWAFDATTALGLHGLATTSLTTGLVIELDEAARFWMRAVQVRGQTPRGDVYMAWLDGDRPTMQAAVGSRCFCLLGLIELRIEERLPPTVRVELPGGGAVVPVVTVEEVERAHPAHAEVLARYRSRRSLGG